MIELIAELATGHHGDVGLAEAMLVAAAHAGADTVKTQAYDPAKINPSDSQAQWLRESYLPPEAHQRLMATAQQQGVQYLSTPFCADSLTMLRGLGLKRFKIASSECDSLWWQIAPAVDGEQWIISYPWGRTRTGRTHTDERLLPHLRLTAIPLYPTPLECVSQATLLDGYSDHCEGIAACQYMLAQGAKVLEVHFTIPGARHLVFDKTAEDVQRLRECADACETMRSGVGQKWRDRWVRA